MSPQGSEVSSTRETASTEVSGDREARPLKTVLFISYFFPPAGYVGSFRSLHFVRHLPGRGWRPTVLTTTASTHLRIDEALLRKVPAELSVSRVASPEASRAYRRLGRWPARLLVSGFMLPDGNAAWAPGAMREGLGIARRERIDLIYASAKPNSSLVLAVHLGRRLGLPTVVDLRDPWTLERDFRPLTPVHAGAQRRWEKYVFEGASRIIVNTEVARDQLLEAYPRLPPGKVASIPNGFDPADRPGPTDRAHPSKMSILYTGTLTGGRNPLPFFQALGGLFREAPEARHEIRVEFLCPEAAAREAARRAGVEGDLLFSATVPRTESLRRQAASDLLLLIQFKGRYADAQLPAKVYEYLGLAGRPVLALATRGAVTELIERTKGGVVVDPDDVEGIKGAIRRLWTRWRPDRSLTWKLDEEALASHEVSRLTERLARQFDEAGGAHVHTERASR